MTRYRAISLLLIATAAACSDPAPTTGSLIVEVTGLPATFEANIVVTGPNGFQRSIDATTTLSDLAPGAYEVRSVLVATPLALYSPALEAQPRTVTAGHTESVAVAYALASGSVALTIDGLPAGVGALVRIVSNTFSRTVAASGVVGAIPPGEYQIVADTFSSAIGDRFGATVFSQPITIAVSSTPTVASVTYALVSATLSVAVSGLAFGPTNAVTITGPGGFARSTASAIVYRGLAPGAYEVAAIPVSVCPSMYTPAVTQQVFHLVAGQSQDAAVVYTASTPSASTLNLKIEQAYLVQSVQRVDGSVPIVAQRPALLRVFGVSNQCNAVTPRIRVRFSNGDSVVLNAPQPSAPQQAVVAPLSISWNAWIPADKVLPGLSYVAEIDPENLVEEANEADNRFPAIGPRSAGVVAVPPLNLTFVPVIQSGVTGDVHTGNTNAYLAATREMLPLSQINVAVAPPMTSQVTFANGGQTQFQQILQEVQVRRITDGKTGPYDHYYGVIRPAPGITFLTYGGMAYVPGQTAVGVQVGWFNNPRQSTELVAHELSHGFGRSHAPCGAAGGPDPVFPHVGGTIGAHGYDVWIAADAPFVGYKGPQTPDIMGYCQLPWISDYTFEGVLNFRGPAVVASQGSEPGPVSTVVVSGQFDGASLVIDPVFSVETRPLLPAVSGSYLLEGRDGSGATVFRMPFAPAALDHGAPVVRHFAFAIPLSAAEISRLREVRVTGGGRAASRRPALGLARMRAAQSQDPGDRAGVQLRRRSATEVEALWSDADWPGALIRDPMTGSLLAFGRGGRAIVVTRHNELDLVLSDGVQSVQIRGRVGFP